MPSERNDKYFATVNLSTQLLISLCKTAHASRLNARSSTLFASLHNFRASSRTFTCATYELRKNKCPRRMKLVLESFRDGKTFALIPLRRSVEVDLDGLFRACDVVPSPEGLPTFRYNLYQHSAKRSIRHVSDALAVGLHI